ncbi:terminase large subunit [uncultured Mediterranean phage uvMED]|nr:terminase large subunit [uncultured Mediterranean phage uvMED]BAR22589.1 phage terminase [uncultured Mediterranean phage uvMED]
MIEVELPAFKEMVNPPFKDLFNNKNRILLLWGGRGSGKTYAAAMKIIYMMLTAPYFKGILIRKVYDTIKESQFDSIKQAIEEMGLNSLFSFKVSPLSITCINGNRLIARGLDKAEKIKSIKDPSFVWYEEGNEITEEDFNTVSTTVRSTKAEYLQEMFSFNPESDTPDFLDFWIHKRFFNHTNEKDFTTKVEVETPDGPITYAYTSIHSTYKDNPHLPSSIAATYEDFKRTSPYYYNVYTLGLWGNKEVGARFYKTFTLDSVEPVEYAPELPLHLSLDENVNPYLTLTVSQIHNDSEMMIIKQIDEICLKSPRNTLQETCKEFKSKYRDHTEGVYIYGDATSRKADTKLQKGENFFTLAMNYLEEFKPILRVPKQNPPVKSRGEFINQIFLNNIEGVKIIIGENCTNSIADLLYLKEGADGTKHKEKTTDKVSGVRYEKYGHCSDVLDYLTIQLFNAKFQTFMRGGTIKKPIFGKRKSPKRF